MTLRPLCRLVLAGATLLPLLARAQVPSPSVEGPITSPGSAFIQGTSFDLAQVGYVQEEFFLSGTARAFTNTGALGPDGRWSAAPAGTAAYKTRIVVFRPASKRKFNGTVAVEWLNVSAGLEAAADWTFLHTELVRAGSAWVGVSAQFVGVEGGPGLVPIPGLMLWLKAANPARYASLHHPGDAFSYDIYSQAAQAIRATSGTSPLGGLKPKRVIAVGESQSAFRMVTYVDAIHPTARVFDGFFVHSRGGILGAALSEAPEPSIAVPANAPIRTDVDVPVLVFETESDLTFLDYFAARQEDSDHVRVWEVAGTAHADTYTVQVGMGDLGKSPDVVGLVVTSSPLPGIVECDEPINSGPQHFVLKAAFSALERWVRRGKAPKSAPRLEVAAGPPVAIEHDANGVALGGVRTPQVDVPIAAFGGDQGAQASLLCRLFGTTTPFDQAKLASLYPTHRAFVSAYRKALKRAVRNRWVLPPDAKLMRKWASTAPVGG